mgnify:CR=1 FL=1
MEQGTTTAHKPVDIRTIGGLLEILGENINSIHADSSDQNIKKTNAILQNVNAIKGIYSLAFDKARLGIINDQNHRKSWYSLDERDRGYNTNRELLGNVLGDSEPREQRELKEMINTAYDSVRNRLTREIAEIKQQGDLETKGAYEDFNEGELKILNTLLNEAKEELTNTIAQDEYLLKTLTPEHFKEYVEARVV